MSLGAHAHSGQPAPFAGIYDVESLSRNGVAITRASDSSRWNRVTIEPTGFMTILLPDDRSESYLTVADSIGQRLVVMQTSGSRDPRFDYRNYYIPFTKTADRHQPRREIPADSCWRWSPSTWRVFA